MIRNGWRALRAGTWQLELGWEPRYCFIGVEWHASRQCELGARCPFGGQHPNSTLPLTVDVYLVVIPTLPLHLCWTQRKPGQHYPHTTFC